jgi:hypothetical protein
VSNLRSDMQAHADKLPSGDPSRSLLLAAIAQINHLEDLWHAAGRHSRELRGLVHHCWLHAAYGDCGFDQMTTEQKAVYREAIRREQEAD